MRATDAHFHWYPRSFYELLARRSGVPRAERVDGGWIYHGRDRSCRMGDVWFDLDAQLETHAATGLDVSVISSMGVHADLAGLSGAEARDAARMVNEAWSETQQRYPGRFFAAAAVPLVDTASAVEELEYAVGRLGLRGVSVPGSVDGTPLDAPRLEPFYACAQRLGVPLFVHPTDGAFCDVLAGHNGRLQLSLGRIVDSSVGVFRLVLGGVLDRYPALKILHFHAGGVLPYAAGRLDKNASIPELEQRPSAYLKRMWVDTAMPHPLTVRMAIEFYGIDRVVYGSDNPCWSPGAALDTIRALELADPDLGKVLDANTRGLVDLRAPASLAGGLTPA
jgi:aminocarboxymuconate-semialdehyde decarboxylase